MFDPSVIRDKSQTANIKNRHFNSSGFYIKLCVLSPPNGQSMYVYCLRLTQYSKYSLHFTQNV